MNGHIDKVIAVKNFLKTIGVHPNGEKGGLVIGLELEKSVN